MSSEPCDTTVPALPVRIAIASPSFPIPAVPPEERTNSQAASTFGLIDQITMLTVILTGAALIRER
ncbi:MAG: hypothetical protein P1U68_05700 [Verrucomicrobiales bacterium]|nr:hypothetical protein [Verrucomicrobiales bacterium]